MTMRYYTVDVTVEGMPFRYEVQAPSRELAVFYAGVQHHADEGDIYPGSKVAVKVGD